MIGLTDTHCHLDFPAFREDVEAVLGRAREVGVRRILIPGIDLVSSRAAVELAKNHRGLYAAVGVHPNQAESRLSEDDLNSLRELSRHLEVKAIGEIGLDYYRMRLDHETQKLVFKQQLELARELSLPVIIHNRQATTDIMEILSEWHAHLVEFGSDLASRAGVLHSFSDNLKTAIDAREISLFIGITGPVTFKKALELREVVAGIPLEQLLIETDSPYLSPEPYRGRRNEPAHVRHVAAKIAELHGTSIETVSEKTSDNADRLFLW